jgi:hypothetical protein
MWLLPPQCLFCRHYRADAGMDDPDCDAFAEIPDAMFRGRYDHAAAFPGDRGVRFQLDPARREGFDEINELRVEMALPPFQRPAADG